MRDATRRLLLLTLYVGLARPFTGNAPQQRRPCSFRLQLASDDDDAKTTNDQVESEEGTLSAKEDAPLKREEEEEQSLEEQINTFLDTEFFNPEDVPETSPLRWFADLVQSDYATAEALYASFFIAGMVLITQELVRMQYYGDQYVPFQKISDGALF